jgi:hypothetical protein
MNIRSFKIEFGVEIFHRYLPIFDFDLNLAFSFELSAMLRSEATYHACSQYRYRRYF